MSIELDNKSLENLKLSGAIFDTNVTSLVSIYEDSEVVRNSRIRELDSRLEKWSIENTGKLPSQIEELGGEWFQDYNHYSHHFDYMLLHSLFISAFSLFENHLSRVVEILKPLSKIKPMDIRGNGEIDRMRKYLHLVVGLESVSSDRASWADLLEYKAIRNALVHCSGILNKENKADLSKVRGYKKIEEHNVWYSGKAVYFRIKTIGFLKGFTDLSVSYSKAIIKEIVDSVK